ncbi:MAG: DUF924 family protein [Pseudomonadota bacterium]
MTAPQDILAYWLDEIGPEGWYAGGEKLDTEVRTKFGDVWKRATEGALSLWLTYPTGTLAYIILTDQFPRNMFRDQAEAFSSDHIARAASKMAISKGWDVKLDEPGRQFFYLPLMHSENLTDQDRCVRLVATRMGPETKMLLHAKAHREVIRKFGRFPTRNEALARANKCDEDQYLDDGGYGAVVRALDTEPV